MFVLADICRSPKNSWRWWGVAGSTTVAVFVADQVTKAKFFSAGFSNLNTGVSLRVGESIPNALLVVALFLVLLVLSVGLRHIWRQNPVATGFLWGGAVGNFADRLCYGGVRDWWTVPVWGVKNNLADWAIFFAVILVVVSVVLRPSRAANNRT
jgi:lipoprotein signal peptidase